MIQLIMIFHKISGNAKSIHRYIDKRPAWSSPTDLYSHRFGFERPFWFHSLVKIGSSGKVVENKQQQQHHQVSSLFTSFTVKSCYELLILAELMSLEYLVCETEAY